MLPQALLVALLLPGLATAQQLATPQARKAFADSTHITGIAEKVMPDPVASPPLDSGGTSPEMPPSTPAMPATVQELLDRMHSVDLYYQSAWDSRNGWAELPGILRVTIRSWGADVQYHAMQAGWKTVCTLTPTNTQCVYSINGVTNVTYQITNSYINVSSVTCAPGASGSASGYASFNWDNFLAGSTWFENKNRFGQNYANGVQGHFMLNSSFNSTCYMQIDYG